MALCLWLPGWAGNRRNIHPLTYPDHQPSFISFFHLPRSIASSLSNLHAWQSFCTTSVQVLFGLPLGLEPSTSYSIHFFTQSVSSFHNTCPYKWQAVNQLSTTSLEVAPSGECLRGEGLVCLIGAVVCLLAAATYVHYRGQWIGRIALQHNWLLPVNCHFQDCKVRCSGSPCKLHYIRIRPLPFTLTSHVHVTILISARWSATLFSVLTGQVSLP